MASELSILAFGDSLTAGYGLEMDQSFPAQLEKALTDKGYAVRVINAGVSGDTTAGGLRRLDWSLEDKPDLVILELGANDALRAIDPAETRRNLDEMLKKIALLKTPVILAGMKAPPNLGEKFVADFGAIYPDLAKSHGAVLYPFFLEGVAAKSGLNQQDGLHPTAQGIGVIVQGILPLVEEAFQGK